MKTKYWLLRFHEMLSFAVINEMLSFATLCNILPLGKLVKYCLTKCSKQFRFNLFQFNY